MKLFPIAFSLLTLMPVTAIAREASPVAVFYGDLNLHSEVGLKAFDRRLKNAIRAVCGERDGSVIPARRFAVQRCMDQKSAEMAAYRNRVVAGYSPVERAASR